MVVLGCEGTTSEDQEQSVPTRQIPIIDLGAVLPSGGPTATAAPPRQRGHSEYGVTYFGELMRLRDTYDLVPFLQPVKMLALNAAGLEGVQFPAGSGASEQKSGAVKLDFSMIVEDFAAVGVDVAPAADDVARSFRLAEYDGVRPKPQPDPVTDVLMVGSPTTGWARYPGGLILRRNVQHVLEVTNRSAVAAGHTGVLHGTYRGYRMLEKGSQRTQRTWEEWVELGYGIERRPLEVIVPGLPASPSVEEVSADINFPADWLISGIFIDLPDTTLAASGLARNILFRMDPAVGVPLQEEWVSVPTVSTNTALRNTNLHWPIPYYVPRQTLWRFRMKKNLDDGGGAGAAVSIMIDGARLIPPPAK